MTSKPGEWHLVGLEDSEAGLPSEPLVSARYRSPALPGWEVTLVLASDGGDVVPTALSIGPSGEPPGALTTRNLREIALQHLVTLARREMSRRGELPGVGSLTAAEKRQARSRVSSFAKRARPGQKGREDSDYIDIILAYRQAMTDPSTARAPVKKIAERFHFSPSTIRNFLAEAEKRGLIEGREHGKPGIRLTPDGMVLAQQVLVRRIARQIEAEFAAERPTER